jgi:hypothetical protein
MEMLQRTDDALSLVKLRLICLKAEKIDVLLELIPDAPFVVDSVPR